MLDHSFTNQGCKTQFYCQIVPKYEISTGMIFAARKLMGVKFRVSENCWCAKIEVNKVIPMQ